MELLGLVECVQGAGNFISNHLSHAFSEPLSLMFMLGEGTPAPFRAHSPEKAVTAITTHLDFVSVYMLKERE